jgi:hypothetical protein
MTRRSKSPDPCALRADASFCREFAARIGLAHEALDVTTPQRQSFAQVCADKPLRPRKPQLPPDIGLFSDDADQLDLVEMFMDPTNEE